MLDRVENINSDPSNRNNRRTSYERFIKKPIIQEIFGNDSMVFSPAAIFLAKLNWHLREISYPSADKIFVDFFIDNLHFQTEIDLLVFYNKNRQTINIAKYSTGKSQNKHYSVFLDFYKNNVILSDDYEKKEFKALNLFFQRIEEMDVNKRLVNESYIYKLILGNNIYQIHDEIRYIFNSLFTFIWKLGKFGTIKNYKFQDDYLEVIQIEEIKVKDV